MTEKTTGSDSSKWSFALSHERKSLRPRTAEPLRALKQLRRDQGCALSAGNQNMISALQQFADQNPNFPQGCLDWSRDLLESLPNKKGVWNLADVTKSK